MRISLKKIGLWISDVRADEHELRGCIPILVTPFTDDGALDLLGGAVALRHLHAVGDAAHVELGDGRALAGVDVLGGENHIEPAVHIDDLEAMSVPIGRVADVRDALQTRHQESTQSFIVAGLLTWKGIVDLEHVPHFMHRQRAIEQPRAVGTAHNLPAPFLRDRQVAGDGFHEVMQGDQPLDPTVFIHNHRRVAGAGEGHALRLQV